MARTAPTCRHTRTTISFLHEEKGASYILDLGRKAKTSDATTKKTSNRFQEMEKGQIILNARPSRDTSALASSGKASLMA